MHAAQPLSLDASRQVQGSPARDYRPFRWMHAVAIAIGVLVAWGPILALLLDHGDPEVRLDAVLALGLTRARAADKPLRARLPHETDAGVRAQIESLLRTLAARPEALLLDEPFAKLDSELRNRFRHFVFDHGRRLGLPTLLVTPTPFPLM